MNQDLPGSRAGGLHSRTIELLDQRGIAEGFLAGGKVMQVAGFAINPLDISDFSTRHNYDNSGLALWQDRIERILAAWVDELAIPMYRGPEVTGFAQDDTGVDVALSDGPSLRAKYLVAWSRRAACGECSPCCTMRDLCCSTSAGPAPSTSLHGRIGFGGSTLDTGCLGAPRAR